MVFNSRVAWLVSLMAGSATVVLLLVLTSGCSVLEQTRTQRFAHRDDAPTHGDLAFVLPSYIPADATDIVVHVDPEVPDHKMYSWHAYSGVPAECTSTTEAADRAPFDAASWPDGVLDGAGWTCGRAEIRELQETFYAW